MFNPAVHFASPLQYPWLQSINNLDTVKFLSYVVTLLPQTFLALLLSKVMLTNTFLSSKPSWTRMLVPSALCWWAGVGNDRPIADRISGSRKLQTWDRN